MTRRRRQNLMRAYEVRITFRNGTVETLRFNSVRRSRYRRVNEIVRSIEQDVRFAGRQIAVVSLAYVVPGKPSHVFYSAKMVEFD